MKLMKTSSTNSPGSPMKQRKSYGRVFKVLVAEAYLSTPKARFTDLAKLHGISPGQVSYWVSQYSDGLLEQSNAVAFSRTPLTTAGKKEVLENLREVPK